MIKVVFFCLLVICSITTQAEFNNEYFASVLKLEERWERLSTKTVKMYIAYIEKKGLLKDIPSTSVDRVNTEISEELSRQLTWGKLGKRSVSTLLSGCSDKTLVSIAKALEGKLEEKERLSAASAYEKCGAVGVKKTLPIMQDAIMKVMPNVLTIVKKYQV